MRRCRWVIELKMDAGLVGTRLRTCINVAAVKPSEEFGDSSPPPSSVMRKSDLDEGSAHSTEVGVERSGR